jgi:ferric-dicitrate binding protein FerR (iron transport regulator)
MLEAAIDAVRAAEPDRVEMESCAARVWARIGQELCAMQGSKVMSLIKRCEDYRTLIPDYLAGRLSSSRALLFTDHTHECVACRNALDAARRGPTPALPRPVGRRYSRTRLALAAAAALAIACGLLKPGYLNFLLPVAKVHAMARTIDGRLYRIKGADMSAVAPGESVNAGERVRTGTGSYAIIELADRSRIEMRERSQLWLTGTHDGIRIHLERGSVIIEAARQRDGHLYVATEDCSVAVVGTVFAVSTGVKGSRVSVLQGEVHVSQPALPEKTLYSGQQMTTAPVLENVSIAQEISWSRNLDTHLALLRAMADVNTFLQGRVPGPQLRFKSTLLALLPSSTVIYGAFPNVSSVLGQAYDLFRQRMEQSPLLRAWWAERNMRRNPADFTLEEMLDHVRKLGGYLDNEIALAVTGGPGGPGDVMVLAGVRNPAGVLAEIRAITDGASDGHPLRVITDAAQLNTIGNGGGPTAYLGGSLLVVASSPRALTDVMLSQRSGSAAFATRPFYASIAESYSKGVGTLFAADLATLFSDAQRSAEAHALGLTRIDRLVIEQKQVDGKTMTRADLSFNSTRSGVAAWLAPPAPMGALEFVSPQAHGLVSAVTKDALTIVNQVLSFQGEFRTATSALRNLQRDTGIDLQRDFAEPLGSEFLLALDGPLLPTPSWKMVIEVYDSARLQNTIEQLMQQINAEAARAGGRAVALSAEAVGSQIYYRIGFPSGVGPEIDYTYALGYMIAAPARALVRQALQYQQTRSSIANSTTFRSLMPADGMDHCSAILYQNLTEAASSIAGYVPGGLSGITSEQLRTLRQTVELTPPTLVCAAGEPNRIAMGYQGDLAFNVLMLGGVRSVLQTVWGRN